LNGGLVATMHSLMLQPLVHERTPNE